MLSTGVSTRNFVSSSIFCVIILFGSSIIPETFAQNPNAAPVAVPLSLPRGSAPVSRPRRVSNPLTDDSGSSLTAATQIEQRAFEMTNAARRENGLRPLIWDSELCRMARQHSEQMVRLNFFSHQTPDGQRMTDRARALGIGHFQTLGENIAYNKGFEDPGAFAVAGWMTSPGHRANILNTRFQQSAIGVFVAPDHTVYFTQEFIAR